MTPPPRPNAGWIDALRPVANWLRDPLIAVFRDENREEFERTLAASALAEYLSDQPANLAGLLMDATEKQFAALYPSVEVKSVQTAFHLEEELSQKPPDVTGKKTRTGTPRLWTSSTSGKPTQRWRCFGWDEPRSHGLS